MTVTIYVTKQAMATVLKIKDLDYYDRCCLADNEATDLTRKEGYYLKATHKLSLAPLPEDALLVASLRTGDADYSERVSIPASLRGCIFEKAPNLPPRYKEIIEYWSGEPLNTNAGGAVYYQNPMNAYVVDLTPLDAANAAGNYGGNVAGMDALLSEGVVVHIAGLSKALGSAPDGGFVEIEIPLDDAMLALDNSKFLTGRPYAQSTGQRSERIFLKMADIRRSPDPNQIFVDALRYEELDYGFYY
ncbi:hypothetical protein LQ564_04190 [Massilia sp. G4R7]|uniref:Uncharacterized protein n=1 Tax=Massilia phyllostachyos TaxID=2898585 RepID=A0ABS8Q180_9BURK|nr:hypothetical protein [Massilia phyllostachyos]MCD2515507.1 hypothetical protein [Massilia phyllostachyos]